MGARSHGGTDQGKVPILREDVREGLGNIQGKIEHSRDENGTMLDTRQRETLATELLERLQAQTTASFQERLHDEQGFGVVCDVKHVFVEELKPQCPCE